MASFHESERDILASEEEEIARERGELVCNWRRNLKHANDDDDAGGAVLEKVEAAHFHFFTARAKMHSREEEGILRLQ